MKRFFAVLQSGSFFLNYPVLRSKTDGPPPPHAAGCALCLQALRRRRTERRKPHIIGFFAVMFAAAALCACSDDNTPQYEYDYLNFENVGAQYLAGPTSYGANLYADYAGDRYTGYSDAATGLRMEINEMVNEWADGTPLEHNFWNGGIAISQWNCMEDEGSVVALSYYNQCSVYSKAANGYGGHNGSATFGVVKHSPECDAPALYFEDGTERVFDHFWVTNSTYAVLAMKQGNYPARILGDGDWLLLTVTGYDKAGVPKGEVEFHLADFSTKKSGGIVNKWTKVDLSRLGAVNRIEFVITGSDSGEWGLNTPGYFCFDDVAVRREILAAQ